MRVLIAGKDSQASQAFADLLQEKGEQFLALGRKELEITKLNKVRDTVAHYRPTVIFNGAAYNDVDKAEDDWENANKVNGLGPRNLAIVCGENDIPLVTFSTDYVFNGTKGKPYTIADDPNPINGYGRSKLLGERFVQSLCRKYVLARVSCVFGVKGKTESNFLKKVLKWANTKDELRIADDQISSPTYAPDLAITIYGLLEAQEWGLCHVTNQGYCSRYEWANAALELVGWKGKVYPAKTKEFNLPAKRPQFTKLENNFNLQPWYNATKCFIEELQNQDIRNFILT